MECGDDVLLACVHYRSPAETERFVLGALEQRTMAPVHITVVDNSPSPAPHAVPPSVRALSNVRVLDPGVNLGYFGAAAFALRDHVASHPNPAWVVISNPDIRFTNDLTLENLSVLHRGNEPAVLAPSIRSAKWGTDQNPFMRHRPSSARMHFYRWVFSSYATDAVYQSLHWLKSKTGRVRHPGRVPSSSVTEPIYAAHGSFLALYRSFFERGGSLAYGAFLFGEEIFIAETARRLGLIVLFEPRVAVEHAEHTSTGGPWRRDTSALRRESSRYVADTFF